MTSFSSLQTIKGALYRFCFSEIARVDSSKYYVAVMQDVKLVTAFEMKKDRYRDQWVVCQPAPEWITQEEAAFAKIIEEATANNPANPSTKKSYRKK